VPAEEGRLQVGGRNLTPADAALKAREIFGDQPVPEGVLSEEGQRVYERLYGRGFVAPPPSYREQPTEEVVGTGVWRQSGDGGLEEIEFEDDGFGRKGKGKGKRNHLGRGVVEFERQGEAQEYILSDQIDEQLARDIRAAQELPQNDEEDMADDYPTERAHPLTLAGRFGPSPSTVQLPQTSFVDPATLLLSGIPTAHLSAAAQRLFGGVALPYSTSTPVIGKTMQQKPIGLDAGQSTMSNIDADTFLSVLMPGIYASVLSVLSETRRRLGTEWAEGLVKKAEKGELRILDAGGGGAGVLAVREMLRAEWERMHEEKANGEAAAEAGLAEADGGAGGEMQAPPTGHATVLTGSDMLRKRASQILDNTTFVPRLPYYVHASSSPSPSKENSEESGEGESPRTKGKFDLIIAAHTLWPLREDYIRRIQVANLWNLLKTDAEEQEGGVLCLVEKGVARGFEVIAGAREMLLQTRISSSPEARAAHIGTAASGSSSEQHALEDQEEQQTTSVIRGEKGMIIAPCTNHSACPMYVQKGHVKGRKEICHFEQRYIRPKFLQQVLGARDKNWEDVKFAYLSVMRGRDLREVKQKVESEGEGRKVPEQGQKASDRAFDASYAGHASGEKEPAPHSLSLPRAILPPLKRRGHVILDLCTPAGKLERWTVPKSYGKQAYRDARKSKWGDLWALGAKTRVLRTVISQNKHARKAGMLETEQGGGATYSEKGPAKRKAKKGDRFGNQDKNRTSFEVSGSEGNVGEGGVLGVDEYGRIIVKAVNGGGVGLGEESDETQVWTGGKEDGSGKRRKPRGNERGEGGKMRTGQKVKGIRDKRDKKASGNGRRRGRMEDE
jgi:ribosomal protein RSM22 (predicted rRNA methylase)